MSDGCVLIFDYDRESGMSHRMIPVRKDFAREFLSIDISTGNAEFVVTNDAYDSIVRKVEMAEKLMPGTALWREDEKPVQE